MVSELTVKALLLTCAQLNSGKSAENRACAIKNTLKEKLKKSGKSFLRQKGALNLDVIGETV